MNQNQQNIISKNRSYLLDCLQVNEFSAALWFKEKKIINQQEYDQILDYRHEVGYSPRYCADKLISRLLLKTESWDALREYLEVNRVDTSVLNPTENKTTVVEDKTSKLLRQLVSCAESAGSRPASTYQISLDNEHNIPTASTSAGVGSIPVARGLNACKIPPVQLQERTNTTTLANTPLNTMQQGENLNKLITLLDEITEFCKRIAFLRLRPSHPYNFVPINDVWVDLLAEPTLMQSSFKIEDKSVCDICEHVSDVSNNKFPITPLVIRGKSGSGKTTLLQKLCFDWSKGIRFKDYYFILFADMHDMRNVSADNPLEIALQWLAMTGCIKQLSSLETLCDTANLILNAFRRHTLIILDNIDDASDAIKSGPLQFLWSKNSANESLEYNLIMTCRPSSTVQIEYPVNIISLSGFSYQMRKAYIQKVLPQMTKAERSYVGLDTTACYTDKIVDDLTQQIQNDSSLRMLARLPRLLFYISWWWSIHSDSTGEPTKHKARGIAMSVDVMKDPILTRLGRMAYERFMRNINRSELTEKCSRDFTNNDLREYDLKFNRKILCDGGFLAEVRQFSLLACPEQDESESFTVQFYHKRFQEFFAALYLEKCSENGIDVLKKLACDLTTNFKTFWKMRQLLRFYFGLASNCEIIITAVGASASLTWSPYIWDIHIEYFQQILEELNDKSCLSVLLDKQILAVASFFKEGYKLPIYLDIGQWHSLLSSFYNKDKREGSMPLQMQQTNPELTLIRPVPYQYISCLQDTDMDVSLCSCDSRNSKDMRCASAVKEEYLGVPSMCPVPSRRYWHCGNDQQTVQFICDINLHKIRDVNALRIDLTGTSASFKNHVLKQTNCDILLEKCMYLFMDFRLFAGGVDFEIMPFITEIISSIKALDNLLISNCNSKVDLQSILHSIPAPITETYQYDHISITEPTIKVMFRMLHFLPAASLSESGFKFGNIEVCVFYACTVDISVVEQVLLTATHLKRLGVNECNGMDGFFGDGFHRLAAAVSKSRLQQLIISGARQFGKHVADFGAGFKTTNTTLMELNVNSTMLHKERTEELFQYVLPKLTALCSVSLIGNDISQEFVDRLKTKYNFAFTATASVK